MNGHHVAATRPYRTRLTGQLALSFRASANGAPPPSEPDRLFEDVVDPRLPAGPLRLEAFDHFRAEADRNRNLLRCGLWAARFGERLQNLFGQDLMRGSRPLKIGLGPFGVVSVELDLARHSVSSLSGARAAG